MDEKRKQRKILKRKREEKPAKADEQRKQKKAMAAKHPQKGRRKKDRLNASTSTGEGSGSCSETDKRQESGKRLIAVVKTSIPIIVKFVFKLTMMT